MALTLRGVCRWRGNLTLRTAIPNILVMNEELELLLERSQRLLAITRKLADDNAALREQLEQARAARQTMQARMDEARSRVETALARLPIDPSEQGSGMSAQTSAQTSAQG
jgi:multidrug resistance efflux pump